MVVLNELDEFLRILGVGGIAAFLEPVCPTFVVLDDNLKERLIARALQKDSVVVERLTGVLVNAEAVVFLVIIFEVGLASPVGGRSGCWLVWQVRWFPPPIRGVLAP